MSTNKRKRDDSEEEIKPNKRKKNSERAVWSGEEVDQLKNLVKDGKTTPAALTKYFKNYSARQISSKLSSLKKAGVIKIPPTSSPNVNTKQVSDLFDTLITKEMPTNKEDKDELEKDESGDNIGLEKDEFGDKDVDYDEGKTYLEGDMKDIVENDSVFDNDSKTIIYEPGKIGSEKMNYKDIDNYPRTIWSFSDEDNFYLILYKNQMLRYSITVTDDGINVIWDLDYPSETVVKDCGSYLTIWNIISQISNNTKIHGNFFIKSPRKIESNKLLVKIVETENGFVTVKTIYKQLNI